MWTQIDTQREHHVMTKVENEVVSQVKEGEALLATARS